MSASQAHRYLTSLDLPPIEQTISRGFLDQHQLGRPVQYGLVCPDVKAACQKAQQHRVGPFLRAKASAPNWVERGRRLDCRLDFALGYGGGAQVEFLGPGRGTRFYSDVLGGSRRPLLHHIGIYQLGIDAVADRLNQAGYPTVVDGGIRAGQALTIAFKYLDTRDELGFYLELLEFSAFGRPLPVHTATRQLATLLNLHTLRWPR